MKCMYSPRDLQQRLDSSFCRYNGMPVYVRYTGNGGEDTLDVYTVSGNAELMGTIKANDDMLDISTPPLGYCQVSKNRVVYIQRKPFRMYKQGVTRDNISYAVVPNKNTRSLKIPTFKVLSAAFRDTMACVYPPISTVMKKISEAESYIELAISNDVAVVFKPEVKSVLVYFKNEVVAWIPPNSIKSTPVVIVKDGPNAWVIEKLLSKFEWEVRK